MKKSKFLIIIIAILIGFVCFYFLLFKPINNRFYSKINYVSEEYPSIDDLPALTKEDTSLLKYNHKFFCYEEDDCEENVSFKVSSRDIMDIDNLSNRYYFYKDDKLYKIYDNETNNSYIINGIPNNVFNCFLLEDDITHDLIGIYYQESEFDNYSFLSFKLNKVLYDKKYKELLYGSKDYLEGYTEICEYNKELDENDCHDETYYLLSTSEEKVYKSIKYENDVDCEYCYFGYSVLHNDKYSYILEGNGNSTTLYNSNLKEILSDANKYFLSVNKNGELYVGSNNLVKIYNHNGKIINTINKYNDIKLLIDDYIVLVKDDKLILAREDGYEKEITNWDSNNNSLVKYFSKSDTINGKYIINLTVEEKKVNLDEKWKTCKKEKCGAYDKNDLEDYSFGYNYQFNPKTENIKKTPTIIGDY